MFKPVYAPSGVLITAVSALANVFAVNSILYAHISAILGEAGTDHTYLLLSDGVNAEVVRVDQLNDGLINVTRAQNSTVAAAFGAGTSVTAIVPTVAIQAMIDDAITAAALPSGLTFVINDPHTVDQVGDEVTINIEKLPLTSPDGTVNIASLGDGYTLDIERGAFGCCPEDE